MDTCGDPYPYQECTTKWRLRLFQIWDRSSMPNFACLDGRLNYDGSCKWWYQPIVQRQLIWRKLCGMWIPRSCDRGMSVRRKRFFLCQVKIHPLRRKFTHPFLAVGVCKIIYGFRVPLFTNSEQIHGQESIFSHDDKVDEESSCCLNHTDLTICHWNKSICFQVIVMKDDEGKNKKIFFGHIRLNFAIQCQWKYLCNMKVFSILSSSSPRTLGWILFLQPTVCRWCVFCMSFTCKKKILCV